MKYLLLAIIFFSGTAFAEDPNIESYVHNLMNKSLAVLNDESTPHEAKTTKVRQMLSDNMDTNWMGRFTLGRIIRTLSEQEASNFLTTYKDYVINSYARAVSLYKGEKVTIASVQKMDDEFSIVMTQVHKSDGNLINVNYLVHQLDGKYKVCDVITEGISLINSQKAEYGSVIASSGINALVEDLKNKTKN